MRPTVRPAGVPSHGARASVRLRSGRLRARGTRPRPAAGADRRSGSGGHARASHATRSGAGARRRARCDRAGGELPAGLPDGRESRPPRSGSRGDDLPLAPRVRRRRRADPVPGGQRLDGVRQVERPRRDRPFPAPAPRPEPESAVRGGGSQSATAPATTAAIATGGALASDTARATPRQANRPNRPVARPTPPPPTPAPPAEPGPAEIRAGADAPGAVDASAQTACPARRFPAARAPRSRRSPAAAPETRRARPGERATVPAAGRVDNRSDALARRPRRLGRRRRAGSRRCSSCFATTVRRSSSPTSTRPRRPSWRSSRKEIPTALCSRPQSTTSDGARSWSTASGPTPRHRRWRSASWCAAPTARREPARCPARSATRRRRRTSTGTCSGSRSTSCAPWATDRSSCRARRPASASATATRPDPGARVEGKPERAVWTDDCGLGQPGLLTVRQGISPGFGDDYAPGLENQFVDVTNVPAGRYMLVHRVNPERTLEEAGHENNAASVLIQLRRTGAIPTVRVLGRCPDAETCRRGQGVG